MTDKIWVVPVDSDEYLERVQAIAEKWKRAGWSRGYGRQNQMLPYGGTCLTPGQIEDLRCHIEAVANKPPDRDATEAAALLSCVLTTGRSIETLASLPVKNSSDLPPTEACLALGSQWVWWLAPGAPGAKQLFREECTPQQAERASLIAIPCSARTRILLEKMAPPPRHGRRLFSKHPDQMRDALRHQALAAGVRCSVRAIEAWPFQQIVKMMHGDVALAALVTGQSPIISKTVIHYTSISSSSVPALLSNALGDFDRVHHEGDLQQQGGRIGSRYAPTKEEVIALLDKVRRPLLMPRDDLDETSAIEVHNAMTLYTVLFYLIATCARPTDALLPNLEAIDPTNGFLILDDKPTKDNFKTRLVWVTEECRQQLQFYRAHLKMIRRHFPTHECFAESNPFWRYDQPATHLDQTACLLDRTGASRMLDRRALSVALLSFGWPYPKNFARHFVRSELVGRISSETLHAFFGHWLVGTEPWNHNAALDPLAFRSELEKAVPALCESCGLVPVEGL